MTKAEKRTGPARLGFVEIAFIVAGLVVIGLGIYGIVRPNLLMPANKENLEIGGQRVVMETRRVVALPRPLSGMVIVCGVGLILLGIPKNTR
jgi:hypothetical protein